MKSKFVWNQERRKLSSDICFTQIWQRNKRKSNQSQGRGPSQSWVIHRRNQMSYSGSDNKKNPMKEVPTISY